MSMGLFWGTTPEERVIVYPCDGIIPETNPNCSFFRGVTIESQPEIIFRWLCQMRVAPYSYDWIDNSCCRSPQTLTEGLDKLAPGQTFMQLFELADFEYGKHLTLKAKSGESKGLQPLQITDAAVSYFIVPKGDNSCRLLVKGVFRYKSGILGNFMRSFLPWADLIMMRRQLLNFKQLAERRATDVNDTPDADINHNSKKTGCAE